MSKYTWDALCLWTQRGEDQKLGRENCTWIWSSTDLSFHHPIFLSIVHLPCETVSKSHKSLDRPRPIITSPSFEFRRDWRVRKQCILCIGLNTLGFRSLAFLPLRKKEYQNCKLQYSLAVFLEQLVRGRFVTLATISLQIEGHCCSQRNTHGDWRVRENKEGVCHPCKWSCKTRVPLCFYAHFIVSQLTLQSSPSLLLGKSTWGRKNRSPIFRPPTSKSTGDWHFTTIG